jgi:hypothetical protein
LDLGCLEICHFFTFVIWFFCHYIWHLVNYITSKINIECSCVIELLGLLKIWTYQTFFLSIWNLKWCFCWLHTFSESLLPLKLYTYINNIDWSRSDHHVILFLLLWYFFRILIKKIGWFIGRHLMVLEAKLCLSSRKISCLKLELDLIIRSVMVMILEVCARKNMASFVMVSLNFLRGRFC